MKRLVLVAVTVLVLAACGVGGWRWMQTASAAPAAPGGNVPVTTVKRGDVTITVRAKGALQGGNSQTLQAPMVGGRELILTELRTPGEMVQSGEVVARFDTTEEEFKLREAEADLAEADQQVLQAKFESEAKAEEDNYALIKAQADLKVAELEARRNPLLPAITARQNELAVESARDQLRQLQQDLAARRATADASIAIQEAARKKAQAAAETARKNIESMTLKAGSAGYVSIQQNQNSNFWYPGLVLPLLRLGDSVRSGQAVAMIPDLNSWEATARIAELDRGHLSKGQPVRLTVVAMPGQSLNGRISELGGTTGPPWNRRFECKVALDRGLPGLRHGMTVNMIIETDRRANVLWLPSQALFESDGRTFVYARRAAAFQPHDVKLIRRSESQVVVEGINEGETVALAAPDQQKQKGGASPSNPTAATKALSK
ncbi:MAG: HlyD family efflux transporter periplasmic adaptor subunit [Bryobacteraceae bacterium]|nr:HlyD family efflux transporter periplasmic adaptor subunit [Bryobacteraceae bacterium]